MSYSKNSRIFILAATAYAALIFYLSTSSNIGGTRHLLDTTLINTIRYIFNIINLPFILSFLDGSLNFVESRSIDVEHVGIYFIFGILLYFAFVNSKNRVLEKYPSLYVLCVGTAYGIVNELFQMSLPYRTASLGDVFSNFLGLLLAQLFVTTFNILFTFFFSNPERT